MTAVPGQFLCGCDPAMKWATYKTRRIENGVKVCPEHGEPMYGYLSPHQVERAGLGRVIDYSNKAQGKLSSAAFQKLDVEDKRDLRSTEEVLMERQREKAMMANGHG